MSVLLETSVGDITIDLLVDERPVCSKNFLKLCKVKYYNFCLFHSVQRNLVAQTGDPTGSGKGGESVYGMIYGDQAKYFDTEVSPRIKHRQAGLVSMVNNGSNKHGSQFFITLGENLDYLDNVHTVFGEVAEGLDVVMKINEAYCDGQHRPYQDIRIYHTVIIDDPFDDPPGLEIPDRSPEPTKEQLDSGRIGADEELDDFEGMSEQEVQKILEEREAKANAQILTMVGDLPEEDIAPPENVLFVCKLNPVTTDEDLEIIFSRFGEIVSCEVIRDQKTKESLQYAFIEFINQQSCENAYFKMDNVLIDDRRIHVDFSQSVSKFKWKGKGRGVEIKGDQTQDDFASKYKIKNNTRKDSKYDLVFSDNDDEPQRGDRKKKKKKQRERRDSSSESDTDRRATHKKRRKSRSPVGRYRSRSRSPGIHRQKQHKHDDKFRDRDDKYRDNKVRDRSDKYRDRDDKYEDKRDKYRDRDDKYRGDKYIDQDDKYRGRDDKHRGRDDKEDKYRDKYRDRDDKYRDRDDKYREKSDKHREKDRYIDRRDRYSEKSDKYREKKRR